MTITRQSCAEHFGRLNDDELVIEFQSGGLTELAREVAAAEIQSRNIDISEEDVPPTSGSEDLVLLARFYDVSSAYLLRSRLEAEGLPSIVADALTYQNIIGGALGGGVRVLVPESYFARAAEIKNRIDSGAYTLDYNAGGNVEVG